MKGTLKALILILIAVCLASVMAHAYPKAYPVTSLALTRADLGTRGGWYVAVINYGAATDTTYAIGFDCTRASLQNSTQSVKWQWLGDPNDKLEDPRRALPYFQNIANPRLGAARVSMPLLPLAAGATTDYNSTAMLRFVRIAGNGLAGSVELWCTR